MPLVKKTSPNARCLPFPKITSLGEVQRAQRHIPDSITTLRLHSQAPWDTVRIAIGSVRDYFYDTVRLWDDLHENFIGLDHAQLASSLFLDQFQPFLQVLDLGGQLVVAGLGQRVFRQLFIKPMLHFAHRGNAAPAPPEL